MNFCSRKKKDLSLNSCFHFLDKIKIVGFSILFLLTFLLFSCNVGLGESLDLEAPRLTITSPALNANTKCAVELKGKCYDNIKVESVTIYDYFSNDVLGKAIVSGSDWSTKLNLAEGDRTLKCVATDAANNTSTKSVRVITLHVDENAPDGRSWQIERGGLLPSASGQNKSDIKRVDLKTLDELETLNYSLPENRFIPQNESFTITARIYDTMGVIDTALILEEAELDQNGNIKKTQDGEVANFIKIDEVHRAIQDYPKDISTADTSKGSLYMPAFKYTHDDLVLKLASLGTGKHYIRVSFYGKDKSGNESTLEKGWFLWEPESDVPGINQSEIKNWTYQEQGKYYEGDLAVLVGGSFPLHFYDDDGLAESGYVLIPQSSVGTSGLDKNNIIDSLKNVTGAALNGSNEEIKNIRKYTNGEDEYPSSVKVTDTTGNFLLAAYVKANDNSKNTKAILINVTVSDHSKPLLVITEPNENQVPSNMNGTKFKIKGVATDTTGCKEVKIAYVPKTSSSSSSSDLTSRAERLLNGEAPTGNEKVKTYTITSNSKPDGEKFARANFEFEFDILQDFGEEKNKDKFFLLRVTNINDSSVDKPFNILGDINKPEILIKNPASDMQVIDYNNANLEIKVKAVKSTGLGIDSSKYKITHRIKTSDGTQEETLIEDFSSLTPDNEGYYSYTIPKATLKDMAEGTGAYDGKKDEQPTFIFYAEDVLGNTHSMPRTVVLSPLPSLTEIKFDKTSGLFMTGNELKMFANFTDTVSIVASDTTAKTDLVGTANCPRIRLGNLVDKDGNEVTDQYAYYQGAAIQKTDSLTFIYKIPEGFKTKDGTKLICVATDGSQSGSGKLQIDLNGATIKTGGDGEGDATIALLDLDKRSSGLEIDSINPIITSISVVSGAGKTDSAKFYLKENDEVELKVVMSEDVLVSGSPILRLPKVQNPTSDSDYFKFTYYKSESKNIHFKYKVQAGDNKELVADYTKAFSETDTKVIKDKAGNGVLLTPPNQITNQALNVIFDTTAPKMPFVRSTDPTDAKPNDNTVKPLQGGIFNKQRTFFIELDEAKDNISKIEFSIDGGLRWWQYYDYIKKEYGEQTDGDSTTSEKITADANGRGIVKIPSGVRTVVARVQDKANNLSPVTNAVEVITNDQFPEVTEISIAANDKSYKEGSKIEFNVFLSEDVKPYGIGAATLTFDTMQGPSSPKKIYVEGSAEGSNKLVFYFDVTSQDDYKGVKIIDVDLGSIQDKYNNQKKPETLAKIAQLIADVDTAGNGKAQRGKLILDGKKPVIISSNITNGGVAYALASGEKFKLVFTFEENVIKGSGKIVLKRKGNWAIPPVIDGTEFTTILNKIKSASDKEILVQTENGVEKTEPLSGQPFGPYKRITQGIKLQNGKYVPDTATKYVLDFKYGITEDGTIGYGADENKKVVTNIRKVLESIDYDKLFVEVKDVQLDGTDENNGLKSNRLTITFADPLPDGREWDLQIPDNAFQDTTGNLFAGFTIPAASHVCDESNEECKTHFNFWSNKVATPVVRADRYSHGKGAVKKSGDGRAEITIREETVRGSNSHAANSGSTEAPWGFVDVRIDCETPNANIKYKIVNGGTKTFVLNNNNAERRQDITDIASTTLDNTTLSEGYVFPFLIGEDRNSQEEKRFTTSRKDYVIAQATKTGFVESQKGREGVYKTVVIASYDKNWANQNEQRKQIKMEGNTQKDGVAKVSGFPLKDAPWDTRYSKDMYCFQPKGSNKYYFAWVSYEIVTDWVVLQNRTNYSHDYPKTSYGSLLQLYNYSNWE